MGQNNTSSFEFSRRRLLQAGLSGAVVASTPASAAWNNWSGGQRCDDCSMAFPRSEAELIEVIKKAAQVRAVGGSHSFSPVVPTQGTLVSLGMMTGLVAHDAASNQATLWAGTRIAECGNLLKPINQGL
ncbi:MAG TPA: FAD-binding protein, partial [Pseudomonadales bacterium]|nr:FAD-binding protein [Pseudomonadales bacterium]